MDPVTLIFGGLALFVLFKLVSVLGTKTGHEGRKPEIDGLQRTAKAEQSRDDQSADAAGSARFDPDEDATSETAKPAVVSAAAAPLVGADSDFNERQFLDGAKAAYEMIVEAFAEGDLKSIRRYLESSVYDAFKRAATQREEGGFRAEFKFVGTENAVLADSRVEDGALYAVVDFSSNQVRATFDRDNNLVDGDPNRVDLVKDRWTFKRVLRSSDPNWTLAATGGSAS